MEFRSRCQKCGFENPPGMRFCGNCGTGLESQASSAEERKLVTILFADVVGSTKLAGAVDPEQLRERMARFFSVAREEIERYGGTLEKFIGDAVMAVFGLPVIHEDDPERDARAAVAVRTRLHSDVVAGLLPEFRIGIDAGEVVANPRATEKGEFLVTGAVVNLAARLQQHAEPGQILIGERAMLALRPLAQLRAVPALAVKGVDSPLPAWEVVDVNPPRERELRATPFIGRQEELELLTGHLRRMMREGRGHVLTILGPAGVGKTRLAREFRLRATTVRILSGRAVPYGTGVPFWALGEAIREQCEILFGDPIEVARQKVQTAAEELDASDAVPALLSVLGLGGERIDLTREALFAGMRTFFEALAQRSPVLLILEDLHLAEDVTLDFIEQAADWIRNTSSLLLVLARPELLERRTSWMGGKRSATTLVLDPLRGEESRELATAILGGWAAPAPLLESVLERAEGNPLFVEEMLRALIERGVLVPQTDRWTLAVPMAQILIPDTVHAVVAARVDALPQTEKQLLQTAAVQGKDFWLGGVHFVIEHDHVEETIRTLVDKELLIRKRRSMLVGEEEFTFRHILIRDVAYASIPKTQRWPKHVQVARWMEQSAGTRRAEWADIIAHHWMQVVAVRRELGLSPDAEAQEQAIEHLLLAGQRAASLYANTTALDHFTKGMDLNPPSSARLQALLGRGAVWMLLGQYERARDDFLAVRALAQELREPRWEAIALDHLGVTFRRQDLIGQALEHLNSALNMSRQVGDPALTGRILNHIGFTYFSDGKPEDAIRSHEEARQLLEAADDIAGLAESFHGLGENLFYLGRFEESIGRLLDSLKICDQIGNRSLAAENLIMVAHARHKLGDYAQARIESERCLAILFEIGDVWNFPPALRIAAAIEGTLGEFGKAIDYATRGVNLAKQIEAIRFTVYNLLAIGMLHREMEDPLGAWQADHEAMELAGKVGGGWMPQALAAVALDAAALGRLNEAETRIGEAQRALEGSRVILDFPQEITHAEGQVLLAAGRAADARRASKALVELASANGTIRHWRVPALLLEADAAAALDDGQAATSIYTEAIEEATRAGLLPLLWRALAGLAEVQRARGQHDDAAGTARQARDIIERLVATVSDERLRATFQQSAKVQQVMSLAGP